PADASFRKPKAVTSVDQANALAALLGKLEIDRIAAFVGYSYGGMVGLAFAVHHPRLLQRLVAVSASHESHPISTALRLVQRRIVELGRSCDATTQALALSRQLAITTFRTPEEFASRFGSAARETADGFDFDVAGYLDAVGEKFVGRFDVDRFLALSESIDLHRIDPSRVGVPTTIVGVTSDRLIHIDQVRALSAAIAGPCEIHEIDSPYGHDSFLKEDEEIGRILRATLRF
ncbi:MAG: alpha/beta fold hydrolase, partial [Mycobacteriales bacterium]